MQLENLVSKLDRVEYLLKHMPGRHNQKMHTPLKYIGGGTTSISFGEGAEQAIRSVGLTKNDIIRMHSLKGVDTRIRVGEDFGNGGIMVDSEYRSPDGEYVWHSTRRYHPDRNRQLIARNALLSFADNAQSAGHASTLYANQIMTLQNRGYHAIELNADISVGRYAWARKGFDYVDPEYELPRRNKKFVEWTERVGLEPPAAGWPYFRSAKEFADYNTATRVSRSAMTLLDSNIRGDDFPIGKAFMLDGHGSWDGMLRLQDD